MKRDLTCGACIRAHLAESGIGCISMGSAISTFLTGKDTHDSWCKATLTEESNDSPAPEGTK